MAKRKTLDRFYLSNGTYKNGVIVTVGLDKKEIKKYLKKMDCLPTYKGVDSNYWDQIQKRDSAAVTHDLSNGWTHIEMYDWKNSPYYISVAVHELFHAVGFLFDRIGLPHTHDTDEAWAYQLDFYTKQFMELINTKQK